MHQALVHAAHDHNELRHTTDIARQWQELIVESASITLKDIALPMLIIIKALDESGEANSREQILHLLAGELSTSPSQLAELPRKLLFFCHFPSSQRHSQHSVHHTACSTYLPG
jgi:hypothetical protein